MGKIEPIRYLVHPKESWFAGMKIRENSEDAFENAIARGMKDPEEWMYMYSKNGRDYFKHHYYRNYKSYPQFSFFTSIRIKILKLFNKKVEILTELQFKKSSDLDLNENKNNKRSVSKELKDIYNQKPIKNFEKEKTDVKNTRREDK